MILINVKKYKTFVSTIVLFMTFFNLCYSQENDYLNTVIERINSLESDLKNIQNNKLNGLENNTNDSYINAIASHEQRLVELEEEIRNLNGSLEELNFKLNNISDILNNIDFAQNEKNEFEENNLINEEQSKLSEINKKSTNIIVDPNVRNNPSMKVLGTIGQSEDKNNQVTSPENTKKAETIPQETVNQKVISDEKLKLLSKNPSEIYSYAYDMLVRENFIEAEKSFKTFIGEHPNDPLASNAYYWLGETYYVQKKFQLAAISFARGFQNFPKGNKALDQLFKLALTFMNLGKNEDACAAFSKLESEFPDVPKRISNRAKEYIKRAKC